MRKTPIKRYVGLGGSKKRKPRTLKPEVPEPKPSNGKKQKRDPIITIWSKVVRKRAAGKCELCPAEAKEAHHMNPSDNLATRYLLANGVALCKECHRYYEDRDREPCWAYFKKQRKEDYLTVIALKNVALQAKFFDYEGIKRDLQRELSLYDASN